MEDVKISVGFDQKAVDKEITALEKQITKLSNKQLPVIAEFEELQKKVTQAKNAISEANKDLANGKIDKVDYKIISDEALKNIDSYNQKIEELRNEIESFDNQIMPLREQLESLKYTGDSGSNFSQIGEKVKSGLKSAVNALDNFKSKSKTSLKSSESAFSNFGKRISNTFKSAFVFSVLYAGLNELKQRLFAMMSTNQQFTSSLNQVKSNLAVAFQPIYQAAMPAINALINLLVKASAYLAAFTNALFGESLDSSIEAAREMQNSINAVESGAGGASAAEKELTAAIKEKQKQVKALQKENKQLQREYEAQRKAVEAQTAEIEKQISALEKEIDAIESTEDALNKAADAQREAIQANIDALQKQQKSLNKEYSEIQKQERKAQKEVDAQKDAIDKQIKSINNRIKALQKQQKEDEKAKKANEKFVASFDELSTLGTIEEEEPIDLEIEQLREEIELLQERKENIGDIDYSEQLEALDEQKGKLQEQIDLLEEQKDAIENVDLSSGIELYEMRISSLREKIDELNNSITENPLIEQNELLIEQLQEEIDLLQEQKDAIQASSDTAASFNSSGLSHFQMQVDDIKKKIEKSPLYKWLVENQEEVQTFAEIVGTLTGAVLGVYGAFKLFSTILRLFLTPQGLIALFVVALAGLIAAGGNGQEVIDHLREAFGYFGEALSEFISGDFEAAKNSLKNGFYSLGNAGIAAGESICNAFSKAINWVIEKFNSWVESLPEDSFLKEKVFGDYQITYRAAEVSFPRLEIPALAQGAVLPPNKPFYALLGEQKNGTNLEAPASLIEEIFRGVLDDYENNVNVNFNGSVGAFIRMLNPKITKENTRRTAFGKG